MGGVKKNMHRKKGLVLGLLLIGMVYTFVFLVTGQAEAACGASVSSCKSCHEIKKELPVVNSGAWHSDHSFGDFCEFCHGGVVASRDKAEAHSGMVEPFADLEASCSSCHVSDLKDRAAAYGVSLTPGSTGSGGSGSDRSTGSGPAGGWAAPQIIPAEEVPEKDLIDYNRVLAEVRGEQNGMNAGNVVLILLNLGTLVMLFYFLWKYDLRSIFNSLKQVAAAEAGDEHLDAIALAASADEKEGEV